MIKLQCVFTTLITIQPQLFRIPQCTNFLNRNNAHDIKVYDYIICNVNADAHSKFHPGEDSYEIKKNMGIVAV